MDPKASTYGTDQGSLIQLGSPIPGFLVSSAPGDSPGSPRSTESLVTPPVAWPCGVIPVAPVAKEKSDPNRILRGPVIGNVPHGPSPNFHLDSHWKVGNRASQSGRLHQCRTAWIQPQWIQGPHCDGVPGFRPSM